MNQRGKTSPKFCLQCKHAQIHPRRAELICMSLDTRKTNLVTGFESPSCEEARYSGWCGKEGIYFEQSDSVLTIEAYQRLAPFQRIDFNDCAPSTATTAPESITANDRD